MKLNEIDLALFDLDGTIRTKRGVPSTVIRALNYLNTNSVQTTVVTGTGYVRLTQLFGSRFNCICTYKTPIASENGGRITDSKGSILRYYPLSKDEIVEIVDTWLSQRVDSFLYLFPEKSTEKALIIPSHVSLYNKLSKKYGTFAEVLKAASDEKALISLICKLRPCMLSFHFYKRTFIENKLNNFSVVQNEGDIHINKKGIDKGRAVVDILALTKVSRDRVLIVGNGLNDLPMLTYPFGKKIVVGNLLKGKLANIRNVNLVKNPKQLGNFLLSL